MKRPDRILYFLVVIISLLLYGQSGAQTETPEKASQRFITIDFENVDINLFIKYISELTGKNFIVDKSVTGNVTIISPTKISEEEAYRVFESVLDVHGFSTVEAGSVIKIIPSVKARSENIRTFQSELAEHPEDKIVTQLIPLKHTTPEEIKKVLAPLVSKTSVVIAHTQSGMLIVTETLSNIHRLMSIIDAIDVAYTGEEIVMLTLEHASTKDVGSVLTAIFQKGGAAQKGAREQSSIKIVPYERLNALVIVATPSDLARVDRLVKLLDEEMEQDSGNFHVFYLQNANAAEMTKVLNFLPGQQTEKDAKGKAPAISKDVKIMADEETNALIINASRNEFTILEGVIKKLDIPRRMVYLEALIMEVNTTKKFEVGVEWAMGGTFSDDTGTGAAGFSDSGFSLLSNMGESSPPISNPSGFTFGLLKQGIQIGGVTFPNIGAVLKAYKNDSDINIISTPQILTTDNKKAEISVGENVPYITSRNTTEGNQDYTNYEYRDVSTKLTITPHINQADTLRLEIATEVIKLKSNVDNTPTTFKRTADTTVIVKNNETVVIGGIIGQDSTESNTRVPLLGDIPLLGWLFRTDSTLKTQTNMFIFITPRIIRNPGDLATVTMKKENQLGEVMPEVKRELHRDAELTNAFRLCELGYEKMQAGLAAEAKDFFLKALAIDAGNPYAHYNLGILYEEEGLKSKALESYQMVIASGTAMTAVDSTSPDRTGISLLQLAREGIDRLRRVDDKRQEIFHEESIK
jgi:general secretion pathway protein D